DDPNAVAPALKQAMAQGVKVVGYDADVAPDARNVFVNQADSEQIGRSEVDLLAKQINSTGQIAILSAASTDANQNTWIGFVKDGTIKAFELWNPSDLGYLAYYVAALLVQGKIQGNVGDSFMAGKLGSYTIGANHVVVLGPPTVFNSANIDKFNF